MKTDYLKYEVIDFAQDDYFISWVRHDDEETDLFWKRFLERYPEKESTTNEARDIIKALKFSKADVDEVKVDQLWTQIHSRTTSKIKTETTQIKTLRWVAVAASVALLLTLPLWWWTSSQTITADIGKSHVHWLPDSSKVVLNATSKLAYSRSKWDTDRSVRLDGEAFFEVKKGSMFSVETNNGLVSVLGTSFNVRSWNKAFEVKCFTGKVAVKTKKSETVLTPGESTESKLGKLKKEEFEINKGTWREGIFFFEDARLADVALEVQRQFPYIVTMSNELLTKPYSGFFTNSQIDSALNQICWPLGLKYEMDNNRVQIVE